MDNLGLLQEFEQQFCAVTAEITSKICIGGQKNIEGKADSNTIAEIENLLKDAHELLERMELEVRDAPQDQREKLKNRVKCYEVELKRLKDEYLKNIIVFKSRNEESTRVELFGYENDSLAYQGGEEQRQRLLDNSEKLERTSVMLGQSYKAALESEQVGAQVLNDLHYQRDSLQRSKNRLRDTDEDLNRSNRVLHSMTRMILQNKFILTAVVSTVVLVVFIVIYMKLFR